MPILIFFTLLHQLDRRLMTNYEECIINLKAFVKKGHKKRRLVHDDDKHVLHIIKFTLSSLRQLLLWFGAS